MKTSELPHSFRWCQQHACSVYVRTNRVNMRGHVQRPPRNVPIAHVSSTASGQMLRAATPTKVSLRRATCCLLHTCYSGNRGSREAAVRHAAAEEAGNNLGTTDTVFAGGGIDLYTLSRAIHGRIANLLTSIALAPRQHLWSEPAPCTVIEARPSSPLRAPRSEPNRRPPIRHVSRKQHPLQDLQMRPPL